MYQKTLAATVCVIFLSAATGLAQSSTRNSVAGGSPAGVGSSSGSGSGSIQSDGTFSVGSTAGGASTAQESNRRGAAELIRSIGQGQLHQSEAQINIEQARKLNIENRVEYARALVELERARNELAQLKREYQAELNRLRTAQHTERRSRRARKPVETLTMADMNHRTGEIQWPAVLMSPRFSPEREKLDKLYARWALGDGKSGGTLIDELAVHHQRLKSRFGSPSVTRGLGANRWASGWQFLRRMENDIRLGPLAPRKMMAAM